MSTIPTSTYVLESAVIPAGLAQVYALVRNPDKYSSFWTALKSSKAESLSDGGPSYEWTFKDGTVLTAKLEAFSSIDHSLTYALISASPALSYTSQISTIRLYPVTSGKDEGSTFVTWSAEFSGDADAGVIADAKYKRKEALADLAKAAVAA